MGYKRLIIFKNKLKISLPWDEKGILYYTINDHLLNQDYQAIGNLVFKHKENLNLIISLLMMEFEHKEATMQDSHLAN